MQTQSDFIPALELARLTSFEAKSIYNWHSAGTGPLSSILVKVGSRLGAWRSDYEAWRDAQRKLRPRAPKKAGARSGVPARRRSSIRGRRSAAQPAA
jgi:predicted DNA-binding transcriptional regulator AlpA